jgi:hypothetical protein
VLLTLEPAEEKRREQVRRNHVSSLRQPPAAFSDTTRSPRPTSLRSTRPARRLHGLPARAVSAGTQHGRLRPRRRTKASPGSTSTLRVWNLNGWMVAVAGGTRRLVGHAPAPSTGSTSRLPAAASRGCTRRGSSTSPPRARLTRARLFLLRFDAPAAGVSSSPEAAVAGSSLMKSALAFEPPSTQVSWSVR